MTNTTDPVLFTIPNFSRLQHYKHRRPAWVKLYCEIFDDYEYSRLSDAAAALLPRLWCIVAEEGAEGCYRGASTTLAWRLRWTQEKTEGALQELGNTKFLHLAGDVLARCTQDASKVLCQSRGEESREREENPLSGKPDPAPDEIPYDKIISMLNEHAGTSYLPKTRKTQSLIRARWNEGFRLPEFEKVIRGRCRKWRQNPDMVEYLRPETLFGTKFEAYLQDSGESRAVLQVAL